ncbi:SusC/RagA family TonB-linked outer membrane protein [Plebeiibacterium sediminum]|uniref:SusC/RagA family TonB-linked outer membrane protein n=1 Tax=Plebeiibacterium sediminum TaxID=2992112 RepID=A0AAE3M4K9_9BACT|nr:SusC/RagA family TonB-linked outer membrane protein [Plebeiobacterium sediminum]MCW3787004.1 SusC/RagA family TonB-linked outer membrane protein [Plebeiobacterium sediminum]
MHKLSKICGIILPLFLLQVSTCFIYAQDSNNKERTLNGFVFSAETGEPLPLVNVSIPDYSAVITEEDGSFSLKVFDNALLYVSKEDYQTKLVNVVNKDSIKIYLGDQNTTSFYKKANLGFDQEELYSSAKSVDIIDTRDFTWKNGGSSAENLINKVTGVNIKANSGNPGMGSDIYIRGFNSMYSDCQPLIIVDGQIYDSKSYSSSIVNNAFYNPLSLIDVNDIENITIQKDGGAIYGAKGANGIIYINTKRAKKLATSIEFTMSGELKTAPDEIPVLDASDYRLYLNDMLLSSGMSGNDISALPYMNDHTNSEGYYTYHNNTNWQKKVFENSFSQNIGVNISGGDPIATYSLSVGYMSNNGVVKETDYTRFNTHLNADINMSDKVKVSTSLGISKEKRTMFDEGTSLNSNPIYTSLVKAPIFVANERSETGEFSPNLEDVDIFGISNTQSIMEGFEGSRNNSRFFGNVDLSYEFSKNFKISENLGLTYDNSKESLYSPIIGVVDDTLKNGVGDNRMAGSSYAFHSVASDTRISWKKALSYKSNVDLIAGGRLTVNRYTNDWAVGYNSTGDQMTDVADADKEFVSLYGANGNWNDITYYVSGKYMLNNKYFFNAELSLNGSSRFGSEAPGLSLFDNQFGLFYNASAAWIVSSENFMADCNLINLLKLRASYTVVGNDDIGDYESELYYTDTQFMLYKGLLRANLQNESLQWETVNKLNVGIDLSVLKERLHLSVDYFNNYTSNMLVNMPASVETGYNSYFDNQGEMENSGIDLSLKGRIINSKDFKWDLEAGISMYKNEIKKLPEDKIITEIADGYVISKEGNPAGLFYGYKTHGVYASDVEAANAGLSYETSATTTAPFQGGDMHFDDLDGNGIINENDMQVVGDPNPDFTGYLATSVQFKNITLDAVMDYSFGGDVYNYQRYKLESMSGYENQTKAVLNRWNYDGQETDMPHLSYGDPQGNSSFSDRWIEDGSFMRLKQVTLSYKLPVKSEVIRNFQVFVKGNNLLTLTDYLGRDPDFSVNSGSLFQGIDLGLCPQVTSVLVGVKIGL